ncbi:calcineurin-like phosphoesterase C-terminal domain-containing protein [Sphingobacterium sp. DN00404]|uniref:Calcineurin-like phosphoesterase C-terminal domain-containing protein n=1 Tax=Sphingobacterium micropteri TaxID=2763501 RepID=A0ABR7YLE8_9SPHI|nr:calcineurin-like phosphoesterase family protein [Sphingobacterium micropteri]MBD1432051.1 calcineurin-like phosphoesterase C-terminal domain-containing protein [Sphingobacterium micropteri]
MKTNLKLLLSTGFLLLSAWSYAQQQAQGTVYLDANRNGKKDGIETGLPNVPVSNGVDVVLTDAQGRYTLPVGNDDIIFVIKPSGYTIPLDRHYLPKSFYIHKPQGSPTDLTYAGVTPTGPLPKSIDFGLTKSRENDQFRVLVFGDPQAYTAQEMLFFNRAIVDEVVGIKNVTFGISLGDLVGDDLSLHLSYKESVARIGLPWYNLKGNHDMNYDVQADSLSDETFEANFGPANYSFNYGKVHFIVLDNVRYPNPRTGKGYLGGFRKEQLDFVKNDLKHVPTDHLIVLAFHIPLDHRNGDTFRAEDRQRLFDLLREYPHTLSLSAHMHTQTQHFYDEKDGWHQEKPHHEYNAGTTSGDWYSGQLDNRGVPSATMRDGTPNGYAFIDFDKNQYRIRYQASGRDSTYQINLFHPKVVGQGKRSRSAIFANFFMGHHGNMVEYTVDGGEWKKMMPVRTSDPAYLAELYPWDNLDTLLPGRRPTDAMPSAHLWRVSLPVDLAVGEHRIRVRATDDYGNTYEASSSYRIAPTKNYPDPPSRKH